jgi:RNA polymerase sigma-70 factor (ECF subfamily)
MPEEPTESAALHREAVRRFVQRMVRDETLAEDLTQETYLRARRTRSRHRGDASERSWLCAIALNLVRDHSRAGSRHPTSSPGPAAIDRIPSDQDPLRNAMEAEMSVCVGEFVLQLPPPQCDVVALHDAAGLTHPEIADLLGISTANSRVILHRGRQALRALLEDNCVLSFDGDGVPCERRPASGEGARSRGSPAAGEASRSRPPRRVASAPKTR